jgi:thiol-disulfide isomerase/thioredoxin
MAPHLDRWDSQFRDKGLRVIEVEYGPATSLGELEANLRRKGVAYPVLHDADGSVTQRFGVGAFPTAFLVNRIGRVVWHGFPGRDVAGVEARIRAELAK